MNLFILLTVVALIVSQNTVVSQSTATPPVTNFQSTKPQNITLPANVTRTNQSTATPPVTTNFPLSPVCQAENSRNNLIAKLSPAGQKNIQLILMDTQYTAGVFIQPYLNLTYLLYSTRINQILNSTDASKMVQLGDLFCYNNPLCGTGPVKSYCAIQAAVNNLVNSFSSSNIQTAVDLVNAFVYGLKSYNDTVLNLVNYFDSTQMANLLVTENPSVLNALSAYSYIYNFL